jgi:toxin-antitoxin system PIN domain toxin
LILVDANLLIYAHHLRTPQQQAAHAWLDAQINGASRVGLPWPVLLAFMRITTNPRVFPKPHTMADAWKQIDAWLARDNVWIPQPTDRHAETLSRLLIGARVTRNLASDAHLAALAIEYGLTLCSTDSDFARFPGLRWINPLMASSP